MYHLTGQNGVQDQSGDEAVQDQVVVDLLHCRVDAGEGAEEIIEYLRDGMRQSAYPKQES